MKLLLESSQSPLFGILWKWSVLFALAWAAHGVLRFRDARWRLILWRGILCFVLALPLVALLPLPAFQVPVQDLGGVFTLAAPGATAPRPADKTMAPWTAQPMAPMMAGAARKGAVEVAQGGHLVPNRLFLAVSLPGILITVWAAGALFGAIRLLCFMFQLSALRKAATPAGPAIERLAGENLERLRIGRLHQVLLSDSAVSPFAFGIFQAAIMLPRKLAQSLPPEEMAALLGHEMAHLRSHDLFWGAGWRWTQAIFWFHPLVWRIPQAHSLACEEEADRVACSQSEDRAAYARSLARLTLQVLAIPPMETQLSANATAQITRRLCRLEKGPGTWKPTHSLAAVGLVLAMVLLSAGCNPAKQGTEVEQLKLKVALLEAKINELQRRLPAMQAESPQSEEQARQQAYRARFEGRRALDKTKYTQAQLTEAEAMYADSENQAGTRECIEILEKIAKKYPGSNRIGCGFLTLAQSSTGPESEKYLKQCIQEYDDCYYGDGVQVGAFARFCLAQYYSKNNENGKAEALYKEIKESYSDAIDHQGRLLIDLLK
jgi:beta-lactamase regulating signal transducer with metallopeptidase domain